MVPTREKKKSYNGQLLTAPDRSKNEASITCGTDGVVGAAAGLGLRVVSRTRFSFDLVILLPIILGRRR